MNIETDHETMEPETHKKLGSRLTDMGRKVARQATDVAHESLDTVRTKAGAAVNRSQDYAREHTFPVLLGTLAVGFAAGYVVALLERPSSFRQRYDDKSVRNVRDTIIESLAPIVERLEKHYATARRTAGETLHDLHGNGHHHRAGASALDSLRRMSGTLKFW